MGFANSVKQTVAGIAAGEVIAGSPYNIESFDTFEDGLIVGRFVKYDTNSIDKLDTSATPTIAGVARRKVVGAVDRDTYVSSGTTPDSVAEVVDFGYVAVTVTAAATPAKYLPVYAVNTADAESGKATQDATGTVAVSNCIFWEQVPGQTNTWIVRMNAFRG